MNNEEDLPSTEVKSPGFFYGYVMVALAFLIMAVMGGTVYTFGIFFEPLSSEFGWTRTATSGAFSLYMIMHGLLYIVTGRLNDRLGPRVVISVCGFFLGFGYLLMSQISAIWHLYLFYGVAISIGMSGGFVPLTSTVARWFIKRRGLMTGLAVAGVGVGTMIMPPAASWLIANYGWRTSYAVIGIMILVIVITAAQFLRQEPGKMRQSSWEQNEVGAEISVGEAGGFSLREAMRTKQFWLLSIAYFGFGVFLQATMVHIVPHVTRLGFSPVEAANIFIAIGGLSIAGRVVMGSASDRVGKKSAIIVCFVLTTLALACLLVAREIWMFYLFAAIFGFAYGGLVAVHSPLVADLFGLRSHGVIFGTMVFIVTVGGAIGPVLAGIIIDITGNYSMVFMVCGALSVIGLILIPFIALSRRAGGSTASTRLD